MEDFVEHNNGRDWYNPDHLLVIDVADILEKMHDTILDNGEVPAYGYLNGKAITSFLFDIYDEIGYLPNGYRCMWPNIRGLLDTACQYFDCTELTPLQRQCWYVATQEIIDRLITFKLYDPKHHTHNYDFHDYDKGTLYLRRP